MPSKREENEGIVVLVRLIKEKLLLGKRIECWALPLALGGHGIPSCQEHYRPVVSCLKS